MEACVTIHQGRAFGTLIMVCSTGSVSLSDLVLVGIYVVWAGQYTASAPGRNPGPAVVLTEHKVATTAGVCCLQLCTAPATGSPRVFVLLMKLAVTTRSNVDARRTPMR
jgi:hypothetical protein